MPIVPELNGYVLSTFANKRRLHVPRLSTQDKAVAMKHLSLFLTLNAGTGLTYDNSTNGVPQFGVCYKFERYAGMSTCELPM